MLWLVCFGMFFSIFLCTKYMVPYEKQEHSEDPPIKSPAKKSENRGQSGKTAANPVAIAEQQSSKYDYRKYFK